MSRPKGTLQGGEEVSFKASVTICIFGHRASPRGLRGLALVRRGASSPLTLLSFNIIVERVREWALL